LLKELAKGRLCSTVEVIMPVSEADATQSRTRAAEHAAGVDPAYLRGQEDAQRGYPPQEGIREYLKGYAARNGLVIKNPSRNGNR
jgi:hypothetical protein